MDFFEFYRAETYHPASVHWPIVLLTIGSIFYIIGFFKENYLAPSGRILLFVGVAGAWLAIYTGNLADGIVSRKLCDPTVLKTHENFAYYTSYLFSGVLIVDLTLIFSQLKEKIIRYLRWLLMLSMVVGLAILTYVGHLGGTLVYDQAAGVVVPSEDCVEFE